MAPYTCEWRVSHCHNCHNDSHRDNPSSNGHIHHRQCRTGFGRPVPRFLLWGYELVRANISEMEGCVLFCLDAFLPGPLLGGCEYLLLPVTVGPAVLGTPLWGF